MLPDQSLPMPPQWRDLLEQAAGGVFARRSTRRLFMALACGLILADRGTVTGMAAAAGDRAAVAAGVLVLRRGEVGSGRARPGRGPADREVPAKQGRPADRGGGRHLLQEMGTPGARGPVGL